MISKIDRLLNEYNVIASTCDEFVAGSDAQEKLLKIATGAVEKKRKIYNIVLAMNSFDEEKKAEVSHEISRATSRQDELIETLKSGIEIDREEWDAAFKKVANEDKASIACAVTCICSVVAICSLVYMSKRRRKL